MVLDLLQIKINKNYGNRMTSCIEEGNACDIVAYQNHQLDQDSDLQGWDLETQGKRKHLMKRADEMYVFCYHLKDN